MMAAAINDERCVIISTHQVRDLDTLIDNILIVDNGELIVNATIDDILTKICFKQFENENEAWDSIYSENNLLGTSAVVINETGEAYGRIESPKGELGFYLISDGSANPYRYRVRPPSLINLTILEDMCLGQDVADAVIILGSVDIVLGEVDR